MSRIQIDSYREVEENKKKLVLNVLSYQERINLSAICFVSAAQCCFR